MIPISIRAAEEIKWEELRLAALLPTYSEVHLEFKTDRTVEGENGCISSDDLTR